MPPISSCNHGNWIHLCQNWHRPGQIWHRPEPSISGKKHLKQLIFLCYLLPVHAYLRRFYLGPIAVIDDSEATLFLIEEILEDLGNGVSTFSSASAFLSLWDKSPEADFDLVICDMRMPNLGGLDFLRSMQKNAPHIPVVLMTAHPQLDDAIQAIKEGACDYIAKPSGDTQNFNLAIKKALRFRRLKEENILLKKEIHGSWNIQNIIGKSPAMQTIFDLISRIANSPAGVLITGESGTGKELVARAIHNSSDRKNKPFIAINCSAIPDTLLESELFGHVKGSFTGAIKDKKGLFEEANGGTLFLDEIGDMEILLQAKLLRVLQEQQIRAVGGNITKNINVRIIAASNKDLLSESENGRFREDLYYRLAVIPIQMPPLRARREDIPLLASHFIQKYSSLYKSKVKSCSPEAMEKLYRATWRGNIRELENTIERAIVLSRGDRIESEDIPTITTVTTEQIPAQGSFIQTVETEYSSLPTLKEVENRYVEWVLSRTAHDITEAARTLGVSIRTLYRRKESSAKGETVIPEGSKKAQDLEDHQMDISELIQ